MHKLSVECVQLSPYHRRRCRNNKKQNRKQKLISFYQFWLSTDKARQKVESVRRQVVIDEGSDAVPHFSADKTDARVPEHIASWILHPGIKS